MSSDCFGLCECESFIDPEGLLADCKETQRCSQNNNDSEKSPFGEKCSNVHRKLLELRYEWKRRRERIEEPRDKGGDTDQGQEEENRAKDGFPKELFPNFFDRLPN